MRGLRLESDGNKLVECRRFMRHTDADPNTYTNADSNPNADPHTDNALLRS